MFHEAGPHHTELLPETSGHVSGRKRGCPADLFPHLGVVQGRVEPVDGVQQLHRYRKSGRGRQQRALDSRHHQCIRFIPLRLSAHLHSLQYHRAPHRPLPQRTGPLQTLPSLRHHRGGFHAGRAGKSAAAHVIGAGYRHSDHQGHGSGTPASYCRSLP